MDQKSILNKKASPGWLKQQFLLLKSAPRNISVNFLVSGVFHKNVIFNVLSVFVDDVRVIHVVNIKHSFRGAE
jgi:hypothetical protein